MRRVVIVVVLLFAFAMMTFLSLFVVPGWATAKIERGDELPLGTQIVIAASHFWGRWLIFIALAFALVIGWLVRSAFRREQPTD